MSEVNDALVAARVALQSGNAQHSVAALALIDSALDGDDVEDVDVNALVGPQKTEPAEEAETEESVPEGKSVEEAAFGPQVESEGSEAEAAQASAENQGLVSSPGPEVDEEQS